MGSNPFSRAAPVGSSRLKTGSDPAAAFTPKIAARDGRVPSSAQY
jgi:hypothetical protein